MPRPALTPLDRRLAIPMSLLSALFLICLAGALQSMRGGAVWPPDTHLFWWLMLCLYPFFFLELVLHFVNQSPRWPVLIVTCLFPPLRLVCRDRFTGQLAWIPWMGWRKANDTLQDQVESHLSLPMIFIALLILPLLAIESFWQNAMHSNSTLRFLVDTGQSIVWLAFAAEFFIMITIVNKRVSYCVKHWIDLFVIILPFFAFMRLLRLGAVVRLHQVTKVARAYRLRGLVMRLYRSLLLLNIIERVIRLSPERRLEKLRTRFAEKELEMALLTAQISELEEEIAKKHEQTKTSAAHPSLAKPDLAEADPAEADPAVTTEQAEP